MTRARFPLCPDITEGIFNGAFAVTGDAGVFETAADVIDLSEAEGNAAFACEFYRSREQEEIAYAIKDFAAARNAHAETEKYFVEAMDFGIADELAEDVSRMISGSDRKRANGEFCAHFVRSSPFESFKGRGESA